MSSSKGSPPSPAMRHPSHAITSEPPPPYQLEPGLSRDSRSSSTQSLLPPTGEAETSGKRILLVVYVHGFYGNDQSFRAFPYHVHHALGSALGETHVIHSKLYPRYKTYRAIDLARDKFSAWLEPHESSTTDVILVGHSMGGILAADVVLIPQKDHSQRALYPFKHRILGTISLDSPFLGLHPGIIASGISSLFQPAGQTSEQSPSPRADESPLATPRTFETSSSTVSVSSNRSSIAEEAPVFQQRADGSFNPSFFNDDPFLEKPFLKGVMKFVSKHKTDGILQAFGNHVKFHLEFGGAVANYPDLIRRYRKIRLLENEPRGPDNDVRVRFVNYYTLSSKQQGSGGPEDPTAEVAPPAESDQATASQEPNTSTSSVPLENLQLQDSEETGKSSTQDSQKAPQDDPRPLSMQDLEPQPMQDYEDPIASTEDDELSSKLPPVPEAPEKPILPELDPTADKEARKAVEKETKALQKGYESALKQYNKALEKREESRQKYQKQRAKESARQDKEALKEQQRFEKDLTKRLKQEEKQLLKEAKKIESEREQTKYRKFCTLPGKIDGKPDPTWIDVYMEGVDEVGAHCGLFVEGPHYSKLVEDVVGRVKGWVEDDMAPGVHRTVAS